MQHLSVLLREAVDALVTDVDGIYVDGTFGRGSVTRALLDAARCRVFAIDRDPTAIASGAALARHAAARLTLVEGRANIRAASAAESEPAESGQ